MRARNFNKIDVLFLMRKSCNQCTEILSKLKVYTKNKVHINFKIVDLDDKDNNFERNHSSITPAVWVNDRMWYAGAFDMDKFDEKLNHLIN